MRLHYKAILILFVIIIVLFFYYDILSILKLDITGAHIWRQADCMAMVQNYKQFDLSFLQPATYNLQSENGSVAGEFPLFYFIASKFEHSIFVLRLMNYILFCFSIVSVYFIAYYFIKKQLYAILVSMLLSTSPLMMYYGTNVISDVTALSFLFIAFSLYLYRDSFKMAIYFSTICFVLSVLFKASYALFIFVPFYFYFYEHQKQGKSKQIVLFFLILAIPTLWYTYAKYYNYIHKDSYYFLATQAIWSMSFYDIGLSVWRIFKSNFYIFFLPVFTIGTILIFIASWFSTSKTILYKYTLLFLTVTIVYGLLFLGKFIEHDYYYLFFMPFTLMALIQTVYWISFKLQNIQWTVLLLVIVFIFNIYYCKTTIWKMQSYSSVNPILYSSEFQSFLIQHNCTKDKSVFCIDDNSTNIYLYAIKRKGFTKYNVNHNQDISNCDFILTRDKSQLKIQSNFPLNYKGYYLQENLD